MDFIFYKLKKAQKTWILFFRKLFHTKPRQGTVRRDQLFIVLIVDTHGSFDFESVYFINECQGLGFRDLFQGDPNVTV